MGFSDECKFYLMFEFDDIESFADTADPDFTERKDFVERLHHTMPSRNGRTLSCLEYEMFAVWQAVCERHRRNRERRYIYPNMDEAIRNKPPWLDPIQDIRIAREYVDRWLSDAQLEYKRILIPFTYGIAGPGIYDKHYPNPNWSTARMLSASRNNGILALWLDPMAQDLIYQELCKSLWLALLVRPDAALVVRTNTMVGYNETKECSSLCVKISSSKRLVHMYPITEEEADLNVLKNEYSLTELGIRDVEEYDLNYDSGNCACYLRSA